MNKNNVKVYDHFYSTMLIKELMSRKTKLDSFTNQDKSTAIEKIFENFSIEEQYAIKITIDHMGYLNQGIWKEVDKKKLMRKFEKLSKRMYNPQNIAIAIPGYYDLKRNTTSKTIVKSDFGNKSYIVTALNKSGITHRCQLQKHLSNGWRFLWTIPGIGPGAMWSILEAIDNDYFYL